MKSFFNWNFILEELAQFTRILAILRTKIKGTLHSIDFTTPAYFNAPITLQVKADSTKPDFRIGPSDWSIQPIQSFDWLKFKLV